MALDIIKGNNVRIDPTVKFIGSGTIILRDKVQIRAYTIIEMEGDLEIGEKSVIGYHNFIQCTGKMTIGKGTLIGPSTILLASSHQITNVPLIEEKMLRSTLFIGDNVWISGQCTINHGITLGNDCIVGANSFVNKSVEAKAIVGGSPAKFIRYR
jgi:maltose O-acetyltransferase